MDWAGMKDHESHGADWLRSLGFSVRTSIPGLSNSVARFLSSPPLSSPPQIEPFLCLPSQPRVAQLVLGHVQAKRYLCHANEHYYQKLSEASKKTLTFQGGVMTKEEAER